MNGMELASHSNDSTARRLSDGLRAAQHVELREHVLEVRLHGGFADEQRATDLLVALSGRDCPQNDELALGEFGSAHATRRLRELEVENAKLKRMYADLAIENAAIKDVLNRKW
jgi:hypothetical protein